MCCCPKTTTGCPDRIYEKGDLFSLFDKNCFVYRVTGSDEQKKKDIEHGEFKVILPEIRNIGNEECMYHCIGVKSTLSNNYYYVVNMLHSVPYYQ